jgi:large subunit ribosomal protein L23
MVTAYQVVKNLLQTEKITGQSHLNKYLFTVDMCANKIEIKKAVEELYKVKVARVNTVIVPGKYRRVRQKWGKTAEWKKAIVTLKEGSKIEVAA